MKTTRKSAQDLQNSNDNFRLKGGRICENPYYKPASWCFFSKIFLPLILTDETRNAQIRKYVLS